MSINRCEHSLKADGLGDALSVCDGGFPCSVCYSWFGESAVHPRDQFPDYPWTDEDFVVHKRVRVCKDEE